jgi:hypothetical protein
MTDPHLGICLPALSKEISHAPIVLEGKRCWWRACRYDRLCGRTNGLRSDAAGPIQPEQMMGMMKQMSRIMDRCSTMMQDGPHEHRDAPATPEKKD